MPLPWYAVGMPNQPDPNKVALRVWVPRDVKDLASAVAAAGGMDLSKVVNACLLAYIGQEGAEWPTPATRARP